MASTSPKAGVLDENTPPKPVMETVEKAAAMVTKEEGQQQDGGTASSSIGMFSEHAIMNDADASRDNFESMAIADRLSSLKWKARQSGYEELDLKFKDDAPLALFKEYADALPKACGDKFAKALEKGLQCAISFITHTPDTSIIDAQGLMEQIVERAFSERPAIAALAQKVVLTLLEKDSGKAELVLAVLLRGTSHRKLKIPPNCVECMMACIAKVGYSNVARNIVDGGALHGLLTSRNTKAKQGSVRLVAEISRWTGGDLSFLDTSKLKTAMQDEIKAACAAMEGVKQPLAPASTESSTLNSGPKVQEKAKTETITVTAPSAPKKVPKESTPMIAVVNDDVDSKWESATPKSLATALKNVNFDGKVKGEKWSTREQAYRDALRVCPERAEKEDLSFIGSQIKLSLKESNVNIRSTMLHFLAALANSARGNLSAVARKLFPLVMAQYKEKQQKLRVALSAALDAMIKHCLTLSVVWDHVEKNLTAANPLLRLGIWEWMERLVLSTKFAESGPADRDVLRDVARHAAETASDDKDPKVRAKAKDLIWALKGVQSNVQEVVAALQVLEKQHPKVFIKKKDVNSSAPQKDLRKKSQRPASSANPRSTKSSSATVPMAKGNKSSSSSVKAVSTAKSKGPTLKVNAGSAGNKEESSSSKLMTLEDALELIGAALKDSDDTLTLIDSAKWTERKQAIESLTEIAGGANVEALAVLLSAKTKKFTDRNFNITKATMACLRKAIAECNTGNFGPLPIRIMELIVTPMCACFSDRKLWGTLEELFIAIMANTVAGPVRVFERIKAQFTEKKIKSVAGIAQVHVFLTKVALGFGSSAISPFTIAQFAVGDCGLGHANVKVRNAAEFLLKEMCKSGVATAAALSGALDGVQDNRRSAVIKMMESVTPAEVTESSPALTVKAKEATAPSSASGKGPLRRKKFAIDSNVLTQMLVKEGKHAWKKRSSALDSVGSALRASGAASIEWDGASREVLVALRSSLGDSNPKLQAKAARVISLFATALGDQTKGATKYAVKTLFVTLGSNQPKVRSAAAEALQSWVVHGGKPVVECIDAVMGFVPAALELALKSKRSEMAVEICSWIAEFLESASSTHSPEPLVMPLLRMQESKDKNVRAGSLEILELAIARTGPDFVRSQLATLKGASLRTVAGNIQRIFEKSGSSMQTGDGAAGEERRGSAAKADMPSPSRASNADSRKKRSSAVQRRSTGSGKSRPEPSTVDSEMAHAGHASEFSFQMRDAKEKSKRGMLNRKVKWVREDDPKAPDASAVEQLRVEMEKYASPSLFKLLFPKRTAQRLRDYCAALEKMTAAINAEKKALGDVRKGAMVSCLDMILKWCSLHIGAGQASLVGVLQNFMLTLFKALATDEYALTDYEVSIIMPYLVLHVGHKISRFADGFREIMAKIDILYTQNTPERAVKLAGFLFHGIDPNLIRNSTSRQLNLEEIGRFIIFHGIKTVGMKGLKLVAKHGIASTESATRSAALRTACTGWKAWCDFKGFSISASHVKPFVELLIPDETTRGAKSKTLLEQRLIATIDEAAKAQASFSAEENALSHRPTSIPRRWRSGDNSKSTASSRSSSTSTATAAATAAVVAAAAAAATTSKNKKKKVISSPTERTSAPFQFVDLEDDLDEEEDEEDQEGNDDARTVRSEDGKKDDMASTLRETSLSAAIDSWLGLAAALDDEEMELQVAEESLKKEFQKFHDAFGAEEDSSRLENTGPVMLRVSKVIEACLDNADSIHSSMLESVLAPLVSILSHRKVAGSIKASPLDHLLKQTISALLHPAMKAADSTGRLVKGLNDVVACAVRCCDRPCMIIAVLRVMSDSVRCFPGGSSSGLELALPVDACQIVAKLMMKVVKHEESEPQCGKRPFSDMDMSDVMSATEEFFSACPPSVLKNKSHEIPLRAVKMLMVAIVEGIGLNVRTFMHELPSNSIVAKKVDEMLLGPPIDDEEDEEDENGEKAVAADDEPTQDQNESSADNEAKRIFARISSKGAAGKDALEELHRFKEKYPSFDVEPFMRKFSPSFRQYIDLTMDTIKRSSARSSGDQMSTGRRPSSAAEMVESLRSRLQAMGVSESVNDSAAKSVVGNSTVDIHANGDSKNDNSSADEEVGTGEVSVATALAARLARATAKSKAAQSS